MDKRLKDALYQRAKGTKAQAGANLHIFEGREYHDWCAVVNIFDELAAQLYTVKTPARLRKKVQLARRMATLIGGRELRSTVMQELKNYDIN